MQMDNRSRYEAEILYLQIMILLHYYLSKLCLKSN